MAELDFHAVVAEYADNALLAFTCRFLQQLLKDLAVCRDIYIQPKPVLRQEGIAYQRHLTIAASDGYVTLTAWSTLSRQQARALGR